MEICLTLTIIFSLHVEFVFGLDNNYVNLIRNLNNLPHLSDDLKHTSYSFEKGANFFHKSTYFSSTYGLAANVTTPSPTNVSTTPAPNIPTVSELCMNQTNALIQSSLQGEAWAIKMIDASAKPPADILDGDITWIGDYDECLASHSRNNLTLFGEPVPQFSGEYCLLGIPVNGVINPLTQQKPAIRVGLCVPDSCSEEDTILLLSMLGSFANITANSAVCQQPDRTFDTRATIVMVVVSLFIAIMVIATLYDVFWIQWSKSHVSSESALLNGEVKDNYDHASSEATPLLGDKGALRTEYKPGMLGKALLSFSIYTNAAKILNTSQPAGSLSAINGIRFISMSWVILGHTYVFAVGIVDNIIPFTQKMFKRWTFQALANALVSVDTFFALSGLLLTYLIMKELKKKNGKMNWFVFYFHRFWRLTPPYMLILMTYVSLFQYTGSGPLWNKNGPEVNHCKDSWWYNFLYINNFVSVEKPGEQCMAWTWYLANDMQFFIISPLIIVPLFYIPMAGLSVMFILLLGSWITTGVLSSHYHMGTTLLSGDPSAFLPYFDYYYVKPYCRIGPFLVGMFTGYVLYKTNCRCRINKYLNLVLWAVFAALALAILYGLYDAVNGHPLSNSVAALYNTVHRTLWGACVCWVIFACATGNGGFVNTFLSWKAFVPLSRLTYCAYLVHPVVIYYFVNTSHRLVHFTDIQVIYLFLGNICLSYAVAFVSSLAYESPMMGLEKVIFKRGEKKD